jgi:hypothetical protein
VPTEPRQRAWIAVRWAARAVDPLVLLAAALATAACAYLCLTVTPATATACFTLLGVRLLFAVLTGDRWMQRAVLAAAIGVGGGWSSVAWNAASVDGLPVQRWAAWAGQRGRSAVPYQTLVVGGWPAQAIEGHGRGGAPERLLPGKGLGAMHLNIAWWAGAGLLLSLMVPAGWLGVAALFSLVLGAGGWLIGFLRLLWMLD